MKKLFVFLTLSIFFFPGYINAQTVVVTNQGTGTKVTDINGSAGHLDLSYTSTAFLPPALKYSEIIKIKNPVAGTFVYNTDEHAIMFFDGVVWLFGDNRKKDDPKPNPPITFAEIQVATSEQIRAVPQTSLKRGMVFYNTTEKQYTFYDGADWILANGRKLDYHIGEPLDGGIIFYIDADKEKGSHGLIVKPLVFQKIFYPFEFTLSNDELPPTYKELHKGKQNTINLWNKKPTMLRIVHGYASTDEKEDETQIPPKFLNGSFLSGGMTKMIDTILSQQNHGLDANKISDIHWYLPSIDELKKLQKAFFNNAANGKFSFLEKISPDDDFFSSSREIVHERRTGYIRHPRLITNNTKYVYFTNVNCSNIYTLKLSSTINEPKEIIYSIIRLYTIGDFSKKNIVLISDF